VVEFGVVEPVQEVYSSRAGGGHAYPHVVAELRVSRGCERRQFFMGRLDKLDAVVDLVEGAEQRVDAVAGVAVDAFHAPATQPL
jgi:hypothetical protein